MENNSIFSQWYFLLFGIALLLFYAYKKGYLKLNFQNLKNEASSALKEIRNSILYLAGYGLIILLISLKAENLWNGWTNTFMLFIITNLAILVGILIINIARKPLLGWIIIIISVIFIWNSYKTAALEDANKKAQDSLISNLSDVSTTETVMFDGFTPCDPVIDYKFALETFGKPINEKFTGINHIVYYSGSGDPNVTGVKCGPVHIESADPKNPHIRVIIKKVN
ncbi:MAG: hypothetical protein WAV10_00575 [Minisyncoccia bacterium]